MQNTRKCHKGGINTNTSIVLCKKCKTPIVLRKRYRHGTIDRELENARFKQSVNILDYVISIKVECQKCKTENELIKEVIL